jgi:hypothetical protein
MLQFAVGFGALGVCYLADCVVAAKKLMRSCRKLLMRLLQVYRILRR